MARPTRAETSGSASPPGGGQSSGARTHAWYGSRRGRGPRPPCVPPTPRVRARGGPATVSAGSRSPRARSRPSPARGASGSRTPRPRDSHAEPRAPAPRPGRARCRRARRRWRPGSAAPDSTPTGRGAQAGASPTPPRGNPVLGRAKARERLLAPQQGEDLEEGRRRRAPGERQAGELGQVDELEPELRAQVAVQALERVGGEARQRRSEEHTSELQSRLHLVCRLLLEKKKKCQEARAVPS